MYDLLFFSIIFFYFVVPDIHALCIVRCDVWGFVEFW